jgi:excisionase family DNA binding protein
MTPKDNLPILITVDETAAILRTTRTAVYAMVARAQLPGVTRVGRRLLIRSEHLLRWLDQNRAPSPKE